MMVTVRVAESGLSGTFPYKRSPLKRAAGEEKIWALNAVLLKKCVILSGHRHADIAHFHGELTPYLAPLTADLTPWLLVVK